MSKLVNKNSLAVLASGLDARAKQAVNNEKLRAIEIEEALNKDIQSVLELIDGLDYAKLLGFDTSEIVFDNTVNVAAMARLDEGVLDELILDYDGSNDGVSILSNITTFSTEYSRQNFEPGQVLKAEHLNHMEDGIYANTESLSVLGLSTITVTVDDSGVVNVPVTGIELDLYSYNAKIGGGFYINPIVLPTDATNRNVLWSSSETSLATVDQYGYVSCIGEGDVIITCTTEEGGFVATCNVNIEKAEEGGEDPGETTIAVTSITLNQSSLTLEVGQTSQLTATVLPADATNKNIVWSSTDTTKATVVNGKVTAIAEGNATIIARSESNSNITATCNLIVEAEEVIVPEEPMEGQYFLYDLTPEGSGMLLNKNCTGTYSNVDANYYKLSYTEGMTIVTGMNNSWTSTYPPVIVKDNGTITIPTFAASGTKIHGGLADEYEITLTGFSADAIVYVNSYRLMTHTTNRSDSYYIEGTEVEGGSGGTENPDIPIEGKLQLSTLERTVGYVKPDGTIGSLGGAYYVTIPYTEGMIVNSVWKSSWEESTNYCILVKYNGTYTPINVEYSSTFVNVGGVSLCNTCSATITGFYDGAEVIVNMVIGSSTSDQMDEYNYFYYMEGETPATDPGTGGGDSGETGDPNTPVKVQLSTFERTAGGFKNDGSTHTLSGTYYVEVPYVEGMVVRTLWNTGWNKNTYCPVLIKTQGSFTATAGEDFVIGTTQSIGGKVPTQHEIQLTGFASGSTVIIQMLIGTATNQAMDDSDYLYYTVGGNE